MQFAVLMGLTLASQSLGQLISEGLVSPGGKPEQNTLAAIPWQALRTFSRPPATAQSQDEADSSSDEASDPPGPETLESSSVGGQIGSLDLSSMGEVHSQHERPLAEILRSPERDALEDRIDYLLMPGIAPGELQFATIDALHKERFSIESAIASVKESKTLRPGPEMKALLSKLDQRLATSIQKYERLTEKMSSALTHVTAFLAFLAQQRASYKAVTPKNKSRIDRLERVLGILRKKEAFLKDCITRLQPPNSTTVGTGPS